MENSTPLPEALYNPTPSLQNGKNTKSPAQLIYLLLAITIIVVLATLGSVLYLNQKQSTKPVITVTPTQMVPTLIPSKVPYVTYATSPSVSTPSSSVVPTTATTVAPSGTGMPTSCCTPTKLGQGYQCIQDCGPPVVRQNDPTPGYSCLSPSEVASRKCPICLASSTMIATPFGDVNVKDIRVGMEVWSADTAGKKIAAKVKEVGNTVAPVNHMVSHLQLADGRNVYVSPNHPTKDGNAVGLLKKGDIYDGSTVVEDTLIKYWDTKTYDLLPDTESGFYWADGILMGSTLK